MIARFLRRLADRLDPKPPQQNVFNISADLLDPAEVGRHIEQLLIKRARSTGRSLNL